MGKERWREALVMDLGRGNLLFPNLWGDLYHLAGDDVSFLARMSALAQQNESLFLHRRNILGDPFRNEVYGYAHGQGAHSFVFMNNCHFTARTAEFCLDDQIGLTVEPGQELDILSHFPDQAMVLRSDDTHFRAGETVHLWLRPFEVLMLEVLPAQKDLPNRPARSLSAAQAAQLGSRLTLNSAPLERSLDLRFADAAEFERRSLGKKAYAFESALPALDGDPSILAVAVRLREGEAEWRYSPAAVQIVQALVRIGDQNVQLIPVPESRQFGNTQKAGCSWVLFKVRLDPRWSQRPFKIAVHAYLPQKVEAQVQAWVVKRWWKENTRPTPDGYYTDAPS